MTMQSDLQAAVDRASAASLKLHAVIHGDAITTVETENGPIKTIAKAIADIETEFAAANVLAAVAADREAVEAAEAAANIARDQAQTAAASINTTNLLAKGENLNDLPDKPAARNHLGLGSAATKDLGTTADTVAAGDHTHIDLTSKDQVARDIAVSAYIKADVAGSDAAGVYGRVMSDDFETDTLVTKTNATYVSASKLYTNGVVVPTDITGGLTYGATTSAGGQPASNAFDDNASTYWQGNSAASTIQHCYVDFGAGNSKSIRYCSIKISGSSDGNRTPGTAAQGTGLYYSSDGTNWTLLQGLSIVDSTYVQEFTITAPSPGAYRYWSIGQYVAGQDVRAYEIQMSESSGIVNTAGVWTGKTANWAIYSSGVEKITSAVNGLRTSVAVSGDFEFQATLQSTSTLGGSELVFGCFASSELATFDDSPAGLNTGCGMSSMTNSFWGLWSQNAAYYGSASQATVTGANTDVMKITRVGSTIKLYKNGALAHTWSQTYSGDVYLVLAAHNNWQGWYAISLPAAVSSAALPYQDSGQTPTTATNAGLTQIDRSWKVANNRTITHMAIYETSAMTVVLKVLKRDGAGAFTTVVNKSYSHSGDGWEIVALDSPYTVPGSGDYHVGAYSASNFCCGPASTEPVSYKSGDQTGAWTGATDNNSNGYCALVRVYYQSTAGVSDMTLIPTAANLSSEPNDAAIYVLKENVDSVSEGTDFKVYASVDGGTSWAEASLATVGNFGSTDKLIRAEADVSAQTGTSFKWKITTHNAKSQRIKQITGYVA